MSHAIRTLEPNQPKYNVTPTHTLWENCCTRFEDTQFECGLDACRTRFEYCTRFECGLRPLTTNQPRDNVTPTHTLWDNCCTRFEDTQFACGLRPLRPFGPVRVSHAVQMSHAVRNVHDSPLRGSVYLTNQKIMSHLCIHFGTIVARGSRTRSSNVAFGP